MIVGDDGGWLAMVRGRAIARGMPIGQSREWEFNSAGFWGNIEAADFLSLMGRTDSGIVSALIGTRMLVLVPNEVAYLSEQGFDMKWLGEFDAV